MGFFAHAVYMNPVQIEESAFQNHMQTHEPTTCKGHKEKITVRAILTKNFFAANFHVNLRKGRIKVVLYAIFASLNIQKHVSLLGKVGLVLLDFE